MDNQLRSFLSFFFLMKRKRERGQKSELGLRVSHSLVAIVIYFAYRMATNIVKC